MTGGICLVAGLLIAPLGDAVTLRWTHSIQKATWEEDYRREGNALRLADAHVRATGAGMEAPPDAEYRDGAWHYTPKLDPLPRIELRHSPYAAEYQFCTGKLCRTATELLPGLVDQAVLALEPCRNH